MALSKDYTVNELAQELKISISSVLEECHSGRMEYITVGKSGKKWLIFEEDVEKWKKLKKSMNNPKYNPTKKQIKADYVRRRIDPPDIDVDNLFS